LPCEALARKGLVALLFANTPGAMAPWGGREPVFGTNPIAFAAPLQGREPAVVDLALSRVARGPIVAAKQRGESIPEGWALDADGNATTDAEKALQGSMIPLGDAKGAALAFMVEVLAACLPGANLAFEASSFLDGKGPPPATGQLLFAIDPKAFGHAGFGERMAALAGAIEQQPGARLPGTRRLANRNRAARDGIVISPVIEAAATSSTYLLSAGSPSIPRSAGLLDVTDAAVDLTAKRGKIDRLGQQRLCTAFQSFSPCISVAIGGDHDHGNVRPRRFCLRQKFKAAHARHVDVGEDQDQRCTGRVADALQRAVRRLRKIHREAAGAKIASELLTKQHLDIGFVVNDQNKETHLSAPVLPVAAARGRIILNSVNSPGSVSTSIDPACCLTMIS
jgi:hypothetical protein